MFGKQDKVKASGVRALSAYAIGLAVDEFEAGGKAGEAGDIKLLLDGAIDETLSGIAFDVKSECLKILGELSRGEVQG